MERTKCECCDKPLEFRWTDTHGVGVCYTCGLPYRIYHYEGEGDERKRVEKPPECPIYPEWLPVARRYHAETKRMVFPGTFDLGFFGRAGRNGRTYSGASEEDVREWNEWLKEHQSRAAEAARRSRCLSQSTQ